MSSRLRPALGCLRPGWLIALSALLLSVSMWLPWLVTSADRGGRASAIGGAVGSLWLPPEFGGGQVMVLLSSVLIVLGAMVARGLSVRLAAAAAAAVSVVVVVLTWWYHQAYVAPPVSAGYGFYIGAVCAALTLACSVWALVASLRGG